MILILAGHTYKYECEKIIRIFFPAEKLEAGERVPENEDYIFCRLSESAGEVCYFCEALIDGTRECYSFLHPVGDDDSDSLRERLMAKAMIRVLSAITGIVPHGVFSRAYDLQSL